VQLSARNEVNLC